MARRRCKGKTKAGARCKASPLKGKDHCSAHDPDTPASARFGSPEQARAAGELGGRPRQPKVIERLLERIDAEIDAILDPLFDALEADRGLVLTHHEGGEAEYELHPDHRARIRAVREILDRAYGKPRQVQELTGEGGGAVRIDAAVFADPETRKVLRELKRRAGAARASESGRPGAGD